MNLLILSLTGMFKANAMNGSIFLISQNDDKLATNLLAYWYSVLARWITITSEDVRQNETTRHKFQRAVSFSPPLWDASFQNVKLKRFLQTFAFPTWHYTDRCCYVNGCHARMRETLSFLHVLQTTTIRYIWKTNFTEWVFKAFLQLNNAWSIHAPLSY